MGKKSRKPSRLNFIRTTKEKLIILILEIQDDVVTLNSIQLPSEMTHILTGKGNFESHFFSINKICLSLCRQCNAEDGTLLHHIEKCLAFTQLRQHPAKKTNIKSLANVNHTNVCQFFDSFLSFVSKLEYPSVDIQANASVF